MKRRLFILCSPLLVMTLAVAAMTFAVAPQESDLPPISWSCPMHADVVEGQKGKCPICGMDLAPVRLDYVWSCPVHSVVEENHAGKCPICRRDLVQVTVSLTFTCATNPKINRLSPGKCADGSATIPQHSMRAHGNHSPQHGGMFFMASDSWHHVEGTLPEAGLFRLYLYNDYSKPLPEDQVKQVDGVVVHGTASVPLKVATGGKFLEARIDGLKTPAELTAKLKFKRDDPEYRFDFLFREFSKDVDVGASLLPSQFEAVVIPEKTSDILTMLSERSRHIRALIDQGSFGEIYVDAFQGKDLALALDLRLAEVPLAQRESIKDAIEALVRSAWQLDAYGDMGDRKLINEAYADFAGAAELIIAKFSGRQQ